MYARYLLKFIQDYASRGIHLHAITVQNEPLSVNKRYPTTLMLPQAQAELIAHHLGPLLRNSSLNVRIWGFDHNFDGGLMQFPQQLLRSPARDFIDGIAYHNYAGECHCRTQIPNRTHVISASRRRLFHVAPPRRISRHKHILHRGLGVRRRWRVLNCLLLQKLGAVVQRVGYDAGRERAAKCGTLHRGRHHGAVEFI